MDARGARARGAVTWFKFDEHFIEARYPLEIAFGRLTIDDPWKVSARHTVTPTKRCSGTDGEVHVGVHEEHVQVDAPERPISGTEPGADVAGAW